MKEAEMKNDPIDAFVPSNSNIPMTPPFKFINNLKYSDFQLFERPLAVGTTAEIYLGTIIFSSKG